MTVQVRRKHKDTGARRRFKLRTRSKLSSSYAHVKSLEFERWKRKLRGSVFTRSWKEGRKRRKRGEGRTCDACVDSIVA